MPWGVRLGTGLGVLIAGVVHLWLWFHGYRSSGVGPAFLADFGLSILVAALVLGRGDRRAAWAGSGLAALALLGYALARTVGLFGFVEQTWTWESLLAAGCEAVVLVLLLTEALLPESGAGVSATARPGSWRGGPGGPAPRRPPAPRRGRRAR